jgi:hypothetical protein
LYSRVQVGSRVVVLPAKSPPPNVAVTASVPENPMAPRGATAKTGAVS